MEDATQDFCWHPILTDNLVTHTKTKLFLSKITFWNIVLKRTYKLMFITHMKTFLLNDIWVHFKIVDLKGNFLSKSVLKKLLYCGFFSGASYILLHNHYKEERMIMMFSLGQCSSNVKVKSQTRSQISLVGRPWPDYDQKRNGFCSFARHLSTVFSKLVSLYVLCAKCSVLTTFKDFQKHFLKY